MIEIDVDYAICGGHAIDLFLGNKTRPHKDLDVSVFDEDRDIVIEYMLCCGWEIYEPCGAEFLHKITNVKNQKRVKTNIWCVKSGNPHYRFTEHEKDMYTVDFDDSEQQELDYIEFLFNSRKGGSFLYSRNHDIELSLDRAILHANGIPYLAPEIVLLYKSTIADDPKYLLDFENASSKMSEAQVMWLKKALVQMFPNGHIWLEIGKM